MLMFPGFLEASDIADIGSKGLTLVSFTCVPTYHDVSLQLNYAIVEKDQYFRQT